MDDLDLKYLAHSKTRCGECKYTKSVECDRLKTCLYCGWNPAVAQARSNILRGILAQEPRPTWIIGRGSFDKLS